MTNKPKLIKKKINNTDQSLSRFTKKKRRVKIPVTRCENGTFLLLLQGKKKDL